MSAMLDLERINGLAKSTAAVSPPEPLPPELPAVEAFPAAALPCTLRPWIEDVAERLQCPPDFVAVPMLVAGASLVARHVGLRPQQRTPWTARGNLWALIVGRPGMMKSPALAEALAPIDRLESRASHEYAEQAATHRAAALAAKLRCKALESEATKLLRKDPAADVAALLLEGDEYEDPPRPRYLVSDATYEKLGAILFENPAGVLSVRDEVRGLLQDLGREESAPARGFYLQAWSGGRYTFDRIGRGTLTIPDALLSMVGGIQPGPLAELMRLARMGKADDGMLERFLISWPDTRGEWKNVDRWPDSSARRLVFDTFDRLDVLTPESLAAEQDKTKEGEPYGRPFLRFDGAALEAFTEWRCEFEAELHKSEGEGLEAALSKFRHHVPSLALALHVIEGDTGPVSLKATLRALTLAGYFESHTRRLHSSARRATVQAARKLLAKVQAGQLGSEFTARDVQRKDWGSLTERPVIAGALELLVAHRWLLETEVPATTHGGRPTVVYSLAGGTSS
ncbi:YfjI family protein [Inhella gelatinilytica]|uniref:DUF3987 domain-containing protein n=1 Tax=Inhella gelatinilytica TaxID=2795030 RepID=A0A931IYX5_9BURK|nr:YfjI family protein [Inhella gelatinilytica]MBH9553138.1 DUF3987 domain-containing protein [Inhella gelatinilytica]